MKYAKRSGNTRLGKGVGNDLGMIAYYLNISSIGGVFDGREYNIYS